MTNTASEGLARRYREVQRFVRRRTGSDSAAAEDLTQQVFTEALAALHGDIGESDLGLLFTIARRRLIDRLRASAREVVGLDEVEDVGTREYTENLAARISQAIQTLAPEQQQVVGLKLLQGLSFAEIAGIVGASEGACKMRLRRGLERLRYELEQEGIRP